MSDMKLQNVIKSFNGKKILDSMDMNIAHNRITSLIGPNGSGKTTSFKILLNILNADSGKIDPENDLKMGFLFDDFVPHENLSVLQNLKSFAILKNIPKKKIILESERILKIIGLELEKGKRAKNLSQGMKKKLAFGIALLDDPDIMILDEPFNCLDPVSKNNFISILEYLRDEKNKTILLSSHDLSSVLEVSDDIYFLKEGKIVFEDQVYKHPQERAEELNKKYLELYGADISERLKLL